MVIDYHILAIKLLSGDQFSNLSGLVATNSDLDADRIFPALQQSSFSPKFHYQTSCFTHYIYDLTLARLVTSYFLYSLRSYLPKGKTTEV